MRKVSCLKTEKNLRRILKLVSQWWREARFGMFVHWGPVSLKGTEISWSRGGERRGVGGKVEIPVEIHDNLYKEFNSTLFDPRQWIAIARTAGMKYVVFTATHCDHFALWHSNFTDYNTSSSPFRRDMCAYRRLVHRGKLPCKAVTAVARELAGFVWSALVEYEARKKRKVA